MKKLILLLCLVSASAFANIYLDSTSNSVTMTTSANGSVDYSCNYTDHTTTAFTPGDTEGNITTNTTTTICPAPGASTQRVVKSIMVNNRSSTVTNAIQIFELVTATSYAMAPSVTLAPGEAFFMDIEGRFKVYDKTGREKIAGEDWAGITGQTYQFVKVGAASKAAGNEQTMGQNSGMPGAWQLLNYASIDGGTTTDCSTTTTGDKGSSNAGSPTIPNPASGSLYLTRGNFNASVVHFGHIYDLLWYVTGFVVTTTTAQGVRSGTLMPWPARDTAGTSNGEGVNIAVVVTTATTNAGAITNMTLNYTNSANVSGRTATIASFPATANIGTFVPFQLQAGDTGVKSVESLTLGTSLVTGVIYLVAYRDLLSFPIPVVNVGSISQSMTTMPTPGIRIYNGTCLQYRYTASATTATNVIGDVTVLER